MNYFFLFVLVLLEIFGGLLRHLLCFVVIEDYLIRTMWFSPINIVKNDLTYLSR